MNARHLIPWLAAGAAGVLFTLGANAYVPITQPNSPYVYKWERSPVQFQVKLSTTRNLSDGHSRASSVQDAMSLWNAHLGTVQFASQVVATGAMGFENGVNEIVMDTTIDGDAFPAGVLAVTLNQGGSNATTESDVIFNSNLDWDSYSGALRQGPMDIHRVAIHELGHVLGLDHPDEHGQSVSAIMNSRVSYIDRLMQDDINGGQKLYGPPGFKPVNDLFANAVAITAPEGTGFVTTGSNIAAQRESGEPNHAGSTSGRTVWWKWTAPGITRATVTTLGSNFDTVLAVYSGSQLSNLDSIASNDDVTSGEVRTSSVSFDTTAGTTYYIAVDGWGDNDNSPFGYTGSITLNLSFPPVLIAPSISEQPVEQEITAGMLVHFRVVANGNPAPAYRWQRRKIGGEWSDIVPDHLFSGVDSNQLRVITTYVLNGDQYRVVVTNPIGTIISRAVTLTVHPTPGPVITAQPEGGVLFEGQSRMLQVTATNANGYQWYRDGQLLPGQVNPFYWASTAGVYHVVVSNMGGEVTSQLVKLAPKPTLGVVAVRAANRRTMFLRADGSRWRMGLVFPNGDMIGAPQPFYSAPDEVVTPAAALGDSHEMSVRPDGTLWVSGDNEHGQLGLNDTIGRYTSTYLTSGVLAVAAGTYSSYFIKADGTLWGMGDNSVGQLGAGASSDCYAPVKIADGVIAVAAYYRHALFIKADGSLWAMGGNDFGQLGDGTKTNRSTPVRIAENVASMAVGHASSVFVKHDGTAWAMGRNATGELGDGTRTDRSTPVKVMTSALAAAVGLEHTLWLKTDGTLWIAGNTAAQFDHPFGTFSATPRKVAERVVTMSAGTGNSLFVRDDGSLWGTGDSDEGKLGLATVPLGHGNVVPTPVQVAQGPMTAPAPLTGVHTWVNEGGRVYLRWRSAADATRYEVWRSASNAVEEATRIAANVANALYHDFTAPAGSGNFYWVRAVNPAGAGAFSPALQIGGGAIAGMPPSDAPASIGQSLTLAVAPVAGATYQWVRNGENISGANGATFMLPSLELGAVGLYQALIASPAGSTTSSTAIIGVASSAKTLGAATEVGPDIVHANRNVYDQVLLQGTAAAITADPGQIVRMSYVDLSDDIVQVEFSGAGTLSLTLENATGPSVATSYNQPEVFYMKGHASIVITDADETTNVSVFSVGRITAVNQALFRDGVDYDGMADIAFIAISSANGRFGGLRTANGSYFNTRGMVGVYAPGVQFDGPVYVGDINAFDQASPTLLIGGSPDVLIAGGDLLQANGATVNVGGFTTLRVTGGTNSHGEAQPVQPIRAILDPSDIGLATDFVETGK